MNSIPGGTCLCLSIALVVASTAIAQSTSSSSASTLSSNVPGTATGAAPLPNLSMVAHPSLGTWGSAVDIETIFRLFDTNRDDSISFEEFARSADRLPHILFTSGPAATGRGTDTSGYGPAGFGTGADAAAASDSKNTGSTGTGPSSSSTNQ